MLSIGTGILAGRLDGLMHWFMRFSGAVAIAVPRERDKQAPTKQEHLPGADVGGASDPAPGASSTGQDHVDPDLSHPGRVIPQLAGARRAELLTSGDQISLKGARET